jgi:hypothetical protein
VQNLGKDGGNLRFFLGVTCSDESLHAYICGKR